MAPRPLGGGRHEGRPGKGSGGREGRPRPTPAGRDGGGEVRRPQAPSEKRRGASGARRAKQTRRRGQLDAAREAVRPGQGRML
ncbi:MAG TPA: hypothetical protein VJ849_07730, partial [Actinomycetes bacterium]|nr:hypothetical protein [Actinomycetes bacterium]